MYIPSNDPRKSAVPADNTEKGAEILHSGRSMRQVDTKPNNAEYHSDHDER